MTNDDVIDRLPQWIASRVNRRTLCFCLLCAQRRWDICATSDVSLSLCHGKGKGEEESEDVRRVKGDGCRGRRERVEEKKSEGKRVEED